MTYDLFVFRSCGKSGISCPLTIRLGLIGAFRTTDAAVLATCIASVWSAWITHFFRLPSIQTSPENSF